MKTYFLKNKSHLKKLRKEFLIFLSLVVVLLSIKSTLYEPFRIPSGSMIPTLKIGDFILVDKMAYGLRLPFSDFFSFADQMYLFKNEAHKIKRGDVIVFKFPNNKKYNYIKRVIALPGEKVKIVDKKIFIDDKLLPVKQLNDLNEDESDLDPRYRGNNFDRYKMTLKDRSFEYQLDKDNYFKVDYDEVEVPEGHYFVLGDNRDFSNDSRYWGFVPEHLVKGKAMFIWLSIGRGSGANKNFYFRTDRFGKDI